MENQNDPLLYSNGATKHVLKQTKKPPLKLLKAASLTTQLTLKNWKFRTVQAMNTNSKKAWSLKLNLTTLAGTMGSPLPHSIGFVNFHLQQWFLHSTPPHPTYYYPIRHWMV